MQRKIWVCVGGEVGFRQREHEPHVGLCLPVTEGGCR